jgi:hypothetical protein
MSNINYEVNPKLKHLTKDEQNELIRRYYNKEKITTLIEEYKIDTIPSRITSLFPPEVCEDILCPNCNISMIKDRKSRNSPLWTNIPYCPECNHRENDKCNCDSCSEKKKKSQFKELELKKEREQKKRQVINEVYALHDNVPIELENLTFRDRLYIGSLLRLSLSENMQYIEAIANSKRELAPTGELQEEIIKSLITKKIIVVHPNSDIGAFVDREDVDFPNRYYMYKVNYYLNVGESSQRDTVLKYLMNPPEIDKLSNIMVESIWKEIALAECLQYLKYQMEKVNFSFNPGEKTISIFDEFLNDFSTSQVYGIIYKGVTSATRYYQENKVSRQQAANSVIGACQRYAEKAIINDWEIMKYSRIIDLPQTVISEFFFNKLLKIGDEGFNSIPRKL